MSITKQQYEGFQMAYDYFNVELFGTALPQVLITLQRKAKSYGYFCPEQFSSRTKKEIVHELAMNPDGFRGRDDRAILSTLVHEMCHVWQESCATPPRRCYHDKEWAAKMKTVGLHPSNSGVPGGKETGQHMTHYIIEAGKYDASFKALAETGFKLEWQTSEEDEKDSKKSKNSKVKYTCPNCQAGAWAKPEAKLICGECYEETEEVFALKSPESTTEDED